MYNNIALLIGHLVGDYILQNDWMATNRAQKTLKGFLAINTHCFLYSVAVALCVVVAGWRVRSAFGLAGNSFLHSFVVAWLIGWATHWPIDRNGLAGKWGKTFRQTNLMDVICQEELPTDYVFRVVGDWRVLSPQAFFAAPVTIVVDNTMHLVLMWILFSMFG